jgi:hypothetical protein
VFVCGKGIAGLNVSPYFSNQPPKFLFSDNGESSVKNKKTFGITSVKTRNMEEWNNQKTEGNPNISISKFLKHCLDLDKTSFTDFIQTLCQSVHNAGGQLYITGSVDEVLQVLNSNMSEEEKIQYLKNTPFPGDFDLSIVFDSKDKIKKICESLNHPLRRTLFDQYGITDRPIKEEEIEKGFVILRSRPHHSTKLPLEIKITTYDGLDTGIPELNHRTEIRYCENEIKYEHYAVTNFINSVNDRNFNISQEHIFKNLMLWQRILRLWMNGNTMKNRKPTQIFFDNVANHAKKKIEGIRNHTNVKNSDISQEIKHLYMDDVGTIFRENFLLTKETIYQTLNPSNESLGSKIKYWEERRKNIDNLINKLNDHITSFDEEEKMNDEDEKTINLYVAGFKTGLIESLNSQRSQLEIQIEKLKHELTETSHTPDALSDTQTVSLSDVHVDIHSEQTNTDTPSVDPTEEKKDSVKRNKDIKTKKRTRKNPDKKIDEDKTYKNGVVNKWEVFFDSKDKKTIYDNYSKTKIDFKDYNPTRDITTLLSIDEYPLAINILNTYLRSNLTDETKVKIITDTLFAKKIEGDQSNYSESNFSVLFRQYLKTGENEEFIKSLIPILKEAMSPPKQQPQAKRKSKGTANKPSAIIDQKKLIEELKQIYHLIKSENDDSNSRYLDTLFYLLIKELFEPTILKDVDLPILKMIFQLQKHDDKDFEWIDIIHQKIGTIEEELHDFFSSALKDFFSNTQNQSTEDFCGLLDSTFSYLKEHTLSPNERNKIQLLTYGVLTIFIANVTYVITQLTSGDKQLTPEDPTETQLSKLESMYNKIDLYLSHQYFTSILLLENQDEKVINGKCSMLYELFYSLKKTLSNSEDGMKGLLSKCEEERTDKDNYTIKMHQFDKKRKEGLLKIYTETLSFLATLDPQKTHTGEQFKLRASIHALSEILVLFTSTDNNAIQIQKKIIKFLKGINHMDKFTTFLIAKIMNDFITHVSNKHMDSQERTTIHTFISTMETLLDSKDYDDIKSKIQSF